LTVSCVIAEFGEWLDFHWMKLLWFNYVKINMIGLILLIAVLFKGQAGSWRKRPLVPRKEL
jgi:hypothetical protein